MKRRLLALPVLVALIGAPVAQGQAAATANPTCPPNPSWSSYREMRFTMEVVDGRRVLLAEGVIDDNLIPRLEAALRDPGIEEIRLRSPGGNAQVGNRAGVLIREKLLPTRIPAGWACASSCAFMFMGGFSRTVDEGGLVIMQMFTFTDDRQAIRQAVAQGPEATADLMGEIAVRSARVASEDNDYLIRMGVMRGLLTDIVYRQSAVSDGDHTPDRRCLTRAELRSYNVINTGTPGGSPGN